MSNLDDLLKVSDYITIHVPLNDSTRNTIDAAAIAKMKGDVRIINLARNGLVDEEAHDPCAGVRPRRRLCDRLPG